jgi:hypothetical protein
MHIKLEIAVSPQMPQISTVETKDVRRVLVHLLAGAEIAEVRSIICARLRILRISLLF